MTCPGCGGFSTPETYLGNYGRPVELDVCHSCNGIWFDGRESLMLSPDGTLALFESMHRSQAQARAALQPTKPCPRCQAELVETHDAQRGTRFSYFRCELHGRFISFFQFLREKNLVRQATPRQLAELKAQVKVISCSNCGAPISLDQSSTCSHCQAPVCVLSPEPLEQTLATMKLEAVRRSTVDPTVAVRVAADKLRVEQLFASLEPRRSGVDTWSSDLVTAGLGALFGAVGSLLKR